MSHTFKLLGAVAAGAIVVLALYAGDAHAQPQGVTADGKCMENKKGELSQCWLINAGKNKQCGVRPGQRVVKGVLQSCEPGSAATAGPTECRAAIPSVWTVNGKPCIADKPLLPASPVGTRVTLEDRTRPNVGKVTDECQAFSTSPQWVRIEASKTCGTR